MTWRGFGIAVAIAAIALLAGFLMINVVLLAWYAYADPRDGQGGLAAFIWGLYLAPIFAIVAFVVALRRNR